MDPELIEAIRETARMHGACMTIGSKAAQGLLDAMAAHDRKLAEARRLAEEWREHAGPHLETCPDRGTPGKNGICPTCGGFPGTIPPDIEPGGLMRIHSREVEPEPFPWETSEDDSEKIVISANGILDRVLDLNVDLCAEKKDNE